MNKQYMDFVPSKSVKSIKAVKPQVPIAPRTSTRVVKKTTKLVQPVKPVQHTAPVRFAHEKQPVLGVVEDLSPKFVKTDVPKRPLGQKAHFNKNKTGVAAIKAKPVGVQASSKVDKTKDEKKKSDKPVKNTYRPPKAQFINQDKIVKRPLSKNIYVERAEKTLEEKPKGPVTIISKPEKQAHVGMIVTIIITIILGAAAGTVAFLLLPK